MSASEEFVQITDSFRPELLAYCYRMLGSVHDAEDQVQETLLRAWRSAGGFEGRSSLRTWLYRIATNVCLRALENRERRPLPSGLGAPDGDPRGPRPVAAPEVPWLTPIPDTLYAPHTNSASDAADPAATVTKQESMRLALIAALQYLPARQRAVLILRDVLDWPAAEVADLLDTSTTAINSTLQRARTRLRELAPTEDDVFEPTDPDQRLLLDRYVKAFETADLTALMELLQADAVLEMPPLLAWFVGREQIGAFLPTVIPGEPGDVRLLPTVANGQLAFGGYLRGADGVHHGYGVEVLTIVEAQIARITVFLDAGLLPAFGLPAVLGRS